MLSMVLVSVGCAGLRKAPERPTDKPGGESPVLEEIEGKTKNEDRIDGELVLEEEENEEENENAGEFTEPAPSTEPEGEKPGTGFLNPGRSMEIALMLPFLGDRLDPASLSIDERALPALHFFRGMEMALDSIRRNPSIPDLNIRVYDTEANPATVYRLLSEDTLLGNADVIVGPLRPVNVEMVATIANAREQVVISPFSANSSFVDDNQRFFQVSPSLETHCQTITRHIRKAWKSKQVALICRDKEAETSRLAYFHDTNALLSDPSDTTKFHEYIIPDTSDVYIGLDFRPLLDDSVKVFVVPSWSNRPFIYSVLRLLSSQIQEEDGQIIVYGMPQWMDFDISSYEYFEKLNVHVTAPVFVDPFYPETIRMSKDYFDRYATFPTTDSWLGYDLTLYLASVIADAGLNVPWRIPNSPYRGVTSGLEFDPVQSVEETEISTTGAVKYYANKRLYMLEFDNYRFVPARSQE